jgi:hypothetical protein
MEKLYKLEKEFSDIKSSLSPVQRLIIQIFIRVYKENGNEALTEHELQILFLEKTSDLVLIKSVLKLGIGYHIKMVNMCLSKFKAESRICADGRKRISKTERTFNIK